MTALEKYDRLEAEGQWQASPDAAAVPVVVSFGRASIVLTDQSNAPLTHWSLAATRQIARDGDTVTFSPDGGTNETLSISDPLMTEAIATVTASLNRPRRRRWPVVPLLSLTLVIGLVTGAAVWGPDFLRARAFGLIPPEQADLVASAIGQRLRGAPCTQRRGLTALDHLVARIAPDRQGALSVQELGPVAVAALPNGVVLINADTFTASASPGMAAGWVALAAELGPTHAALKRHLVRMSLTDAARFILTGEIREYEIWEMARMTAEEQTPIDDTVFAATLERLERTDLPGPAIVAALRAILAGSVPMAEAADFPAPISDQDWVALQNLCER